MNTRSDGTAAFDAELERLLAEARAGDTRPVAAPRAPSTAGDLDEIPMLTEVLPTAPRTTRDLSAGMSEEEWNRMALQVHKNVMQRMLRRADRLVDEPLRRTLDELLARGAERLMQDIRSTMQQAVRDAVARAIAEELARVRMHRDRPDA